MMSETDSNLEDIEWNFIKNIICTKENFESESGKVEKKLWQELPLPVFQNDHNTESYFLSRKNERAEDTVTFVNKGQTHILDLEQDSEYQTIITEVENNFVLLIKNNFSRILPRLNTLIEAVKDLISQYPEQNPKRWLNVILNYECNESIKQFCSENFELLIEQ